MPVRHSSLFLEHFTLDSSTTTNSHFFYCPISVKMSAEEEQFDDSSMGGPGAPTPVSALEVCFT
jgi:hypothetical protein